MSEFLETEDAGNTSEDGNGEGSDSVPSFGIGAGLTSLAALLTALVLRRRA